MTASTKKSTWCNSQLWTSSGILLHPITLTIAISAIALLSVHTLGYWDLEDTFASGSSLGAPFGFSGWGTIGVSRLVHSLFGVPVMDFGIIGGYRLPSQGTISTGPFWFLRWFLPAELILAMTHAVAVLLSSLAFGYLWHRATFSTAHTSVVRNLTCIVCWISLFFPTFEYLLGQDWFTASSSYHGFITVSTSLVMLALEVRSRNPSPAAVRVGVRLTLLGSYVLLLGHTGLLALYAPTTVLLAIFTLFTALRMREFRMMFVAWKPWMLELLLAAGVSLRSVTLLADLLAEVTTRSVIGSDYWWSRPTRDLNGLKHFVGQLGGTELKPWLAVIAPDFLAQFNIGKLSRVPHSAAVVTLLLTISLLKNWRRPNSGLSRLLLGLWSGNFLLMTSVLKNPIRVGVDYLYRDVLLVLAVLGVAVYLSSQLSRASTTNIKLWNASLLSVLAFTSGMVSLSFPLFHYQQYRQASPYSLPKAISDSDPWIHKLHDATTVDKGTLFVVDDLFLNRWTSGEGDLNWMGLRGFFEVREAGFTAVQGSPKIRNAAAFTGLTTSLKQSLDPPTADFCDARLLSFLRVTVLITSPRTSADCIRNVVATNYTTSLHIEVKSVLEASNMLLSNVSGQQVFRVDTTHAAGRGVKCGLLRDTTCFSTLNLRPSSGWMYQSGDCELPCLVRLGRAKSGLTTSEKLVVPFNSGNALSAKDQFGRPLAIDSVNGLMAIATDASVDEILITARTDLRMKLHALTGYSQFLPLLGLLIRKIRRMCSTR